MAGRVSARRAAARFQLSCVRLAYAGASNGSTWALDDIAGVPAATRETEAARALVEIADAGDGDALRKLLRPDPAVEATSWTVACYRIGDLAPHALRDFTDPVSALTTLVDCGEAEHLAAELVASTSSGLCWVALVRTGVQVRFQHFGGHSVLPRPGRHAIRDGEREAVETARGHWATLVASWHSHQGPTGSLTGAVVAPLADAALADTGAPAATGEPAAAGDVAAGARGFVAQPSLAEVTVTMHDLADIVSGIAVAVERLERTLAAVATRLETIVPSPTSTGGRAPISRTVTAHSGPPLTDAFGEPGHRWWTPKHRAVRRRPPVGGAANEPL